MAKMSEAERISELISRDARDIVDLLIESQDLQWQSSRARPATEGARPRGVHGDPTSSTALDGRRLAVRSSRKAALEELVKACDALMRARANLSSAIERWRG